jgi:rubredoxin
MPEKRECPMCGALMSLVERETAEQIPGRPQVVRATVREWVCRMCDYFEEEGTRLEPDR